jgi:hypothetical protein
MYLHPRAPFAIVLLLPCMLTFTWVGGCSKPTPPPENGSRTEGTEGTAETKREQTKREQTKREQTKREQTKKRQQSKPRVKLHPVTAGLLPRHRSKTPLLEKEACIPSARPGGKSNCQLTRVYGDGALYQLSRKQGQKPEHWHHLARLKTGTVEKLARLFKEVCDGKDPLYGNDRGSFVYRVHTPGCTRELIVTGIPDGGLRRLLEVPNLINHNLVPGSSEAKK